MHYMTNKYIENVLLCIAKNKTINIEDKKFFKEIKERGWDISNTEIQSRMKRKNLLI